MPKRILYVSPNAQIGGAEQVVRLLCQHHRRDRWEPQAFFLSDGPIAESLRTAGVRTHVHAGRRVRLRDPLSVYRSVRALARLIEAEQIDLVHSAMSYGHLLGGPAARLSGVPAVWF